MAKADRIPDLIAFTRGVALAFADHRQLSLPPMSCRYAKPDTPDRFLAQTRRFGYTRDSTPGLAA
jgi:hypothetical protein